MKHGLLGRNAGWGNLKTGSWGEYLDPRGMRMGSGEGSTMGNFIVCIVHLIYSGWLSLEDWDGEVHLQESDHLEGLDIDGRTILELTLNK